MRVADLVWKCLAREVDHVFYLPGGGAAHLVDALGQSGLNAVCCLNEQAAGYAAIGYAQHKGFGVCLTTSGPGVTNAMTACLAAWLDSVPCIFISGQVPTYRMALPGMRSRGTQEAPTMDLVGPITKASMMPKTVDVVMPTLDALIQHAKKGRPGPVWADIPMDIQSAEIEDEYEYV